MASRFSKVQIPKVSGNSTSGDVITRLAGLDMVSPVDEMQPGRTPEAHDFRLYAQTLGGREVAVSTRKGSGQYVTPLSEALNVSNTSATGASDVNVGIETFIQLQPFTAASTGRLTAIDLQTATNTSNSALRIDIYNDDGNKPSTRITRSSISDLGTSFAWLKARFLNSPLLTIGNKYWMVIYLQDDGTGLAKLKTSTVGTMAYAGNSGILGASIQTYGILHRVYTAPEAKPLGAYRFNRDDTVNRTVAAYGTTMYMVDESTKNLSPLLTGLSASASNYSFTNGDGKVFWVNGYDQLTAWDGTLETSALNLVTNPSFAVNTTSWSAISGSSIARVTSDFQSTPASLQVTAASGIRGAVLLIGMETNRRYKISYYVKGSTATGNTFLTLNNGTTALVGTTNPVTTAWVKREFYYTPGVDVTSLEFKAASDNVFIDDVTVQNTGIEYIIDTELPILKEICFHKDRMFGVSAADANRMVFSENPGNPSNSPIRQQWYYQWLSVSFIYVPRPKNGSPITALIPFQDNLIILTQDMKYVLSGSDRGNYFLRESTGNEGALSRRGVISDPNYIYFVAHDGIYRFNGAKDEKLSGLIQPLFDNCPLKHEITLNLWKSQVRAYMASEFASTHDITAIFSNDYSEWMLDTDTYVSRALFYSDSDDQMELVEFSSQVASLYYAETDFNSLGAPIDFDYRLKYDSRGLPGQRKKFKRYFPLVQAVGKSFPITFGSDKDFEGAPREKEQQLNVGGAKIGEFFIDDGTIITGATAFKPKKTAISGYSRYMQFQVRRDAVNNQVAFMGVQFTYKAKKL